MSECDVIQIGLIHLAFSTSVTHWHRSCDSVPWNRFKCRGCNWWCVGPARVFVPERVREFTSQPGPVNLSLVASEGYRPPAPSNPSFCCGLRSTCQVSSIKGECKKKHVSFS